VLAQIVEIYSLVVLVSVIGSWIQLSPDNPVGRFVYGLTEPVFERIRQVVPPVGGMDLSPMVLLIGLQMLQRFL
jgi:YggT family protein